MNLLEKLYPVDVNLKSSSFHFNAIMKDGLHFTEHENTGILWENVNYKRGKSSSQRKQCLSDKIKKKKSNIK